MKNLKLPRTPIITERIRIDFRQEDGQPLNYIRFESCGSINYGSYLGSIAASDKKNLKKLKKVIEVLLETK